MYNKAQALYDYYTSNKQDRRIARPFVNYARDVYGRFRHWQTGGNLPARVKKVERQLKGMRPEDHFVDYTGAYGHTMTTTWTAYQVNGVAAGDSEQTRTGSMIAMKSFEFRGFVKNDTTTTGVKCRLVFVMLDAVCSDVPENCFITDDNIMSPKRKNAPVKYKTLYDETFIVSPNDPIHVIHFWRNLKGRKMNYTGTGSGDFNSGHIFYMAIADVATPLMTGYSRMVFTDV